MTPVFKFHPSRQDFEVYADSERGDALVYGDVGRRDGEAFMRRACAAYIACAGLSDAALEGGVIERMREALEAFAFRISERIGDDDLADDYEIEARVPMREVRAVRAALALLEAKP